MTSAMSRMALAGTPITEVKKPRARALVIEAKARKGKLEARLNWRPPPRLARPAVAFATDQFANRVRRWNASV